MADFNSSMPVMTEANGDIVSKLCDGTTNTQLLLINTDGSIVTRISDGTDTLAINTGGSINSQITDGTDTLAINTDGSTNVVITDGTETVLVNTDGSVSVQLTDGTDALDINSDGSINVNIVSAAITGEVHDYKVATTIAAGGTDNHDYTVTGTTFLLQQIVVAASGQFKAEIQVGPVATLLTKAVIFGTGAGDTQVITFALPIEVPVASTGTVRVIMTNRDKQSQDLYSTIVGREV